MPIACKTATLQSELGLNKSTIIRARVKLRERGLIDFTEGVQNSCSPKYRLLDIHRCKNATASATAHATDSATADETINKDRDKYNYSFAHQKKNRGHGIDKQKDKDQRRSIDVSPATQEGYDAPF
jgi:DNA-binding transcriptional MocR family regulator